MRDNIRKLLESPVLEDNLIGLEIATKEELLTACGNSLAASNDYCNLYFVMNSMLYYYCRTRTKFFVIIKSRWLTMAEASNHPDFRSYPLLYVDTKIIKD